MSPIINIFNYKLIFSDSIIYLIYSSVNIKNEEFSYNFMTIQIHEI